MHHFPNLCVKNPFMHKRRVMKSTANEATNFCAAGSLYMWLHSKIDKSCKTMFKFVIQAALNERMTCSQFHRHFTSSFCVNILLPKSHKANLIREKLQKALSDKKGLSKMLMKLTPGVNFINVLQV